LLVAVHATVPGLTVTVTGAAACPSAGTCQLAGVTVTEPPACVTVTVWPPIVAVAVRAATDVVEAAVSSTLPLPTPLAGVTVNQGALVVAVHATPLGLVATVTGWVLPPAPGAQDVGDSVTDAPACCTVTVRPATVAVAVRLVRLAFGVIVRFTLLPVPDPADTVSHGASDVAVQVGLSVNVVAIVSVVIFAPAPGCHTCGDTVKLAIPAPCVTARACPPRVTVPDRAPALVSVLAAAVSVSVAAPAAGGALTVSHGRLLLAVHCTVAGATVTGTDWVPPVAAAVHVATGNVNTPAAWVTTSVCPPTVSVAVRAARLVVDAATTVSVALPVPLLPVGLLTVSHD
jgi:hypothetical protein